MGIPRLLVWYEEEDVVVEVVLGSLVNEVNEVSWKTVSLNWI